MNSFSVIPQSRAVAEFFPGVHVWGTTLRLRQKVPPIDLTTELAELHLLWRGKSRSEVLQHTVHAAYAEFIKTLGINLKKQLPSVSNLIVRALTKEDIRFPQIHPAVDVVNLAAIQSSISLGVFDASCVSGDLQLTFSDLGDQFLPIGSEDVVEIEPGRLVLQDSDKILSLFSIRDSQAQAITINTKTIWILGCQVPGVSEGKIQQGMTLAIELLSKYQVIETDGALP